ncbi:hypothetical protein J5226_15695 [Lysobacter sp. K5869]|uniref:hypothetical protein n=1 Tax=Lysobacter sp. K5869 TaxID=2820808 RepID=UPI001C05F601|nr:hypothetical protein [Lysobacter sp. K5869]QWP75075.1 hypothetical protein J5226_15695 [Lysobacter sp. K5869]
MGGMAPPAISQVATDRDTIALTWRVSVKPHIPTRAEVAPRTGSPQASDRMTNCFLALSGECAPWPSKDELVRLLVDGGLHVSEGEYSVRVEGDSNFVFRQCCGDCGDKPSIDADSNNRETLMRDSMAVSSALAAARIKHRFEIYDSDDNFVAYLHYNWPDED